MPLLVGFQSTPSNLSSASDAKLFDSSVWSVARKLTQNRRVSRIAANAREVFIGRKATSGGSSETLVNDWQVMPTGMSALHRGDHRDAAGVLAEHVAVPRAAACAASPSIWTTSPGRHANISSWPPR